MIQTGSGRRWLYVTWVAHRLGVSRQAVHKRIASGRLRTWEVTVRGRGRGDVVVLADDVAAWERERGSRGEHRGEPGDHPGRMWRLRVRPDGRHWVGESLFLGVSSRGDTAVEALVGVIGAVDAHLATTEEK